jgi:hypothetical protein
VISLFVLLLLVAWVVGNIVLWVQFPQQPYRRAIILWALGAPTLCFVLLVALKPMAGLAAFIVVAGLLAALAGPVAHVAFLRWSQAERSSGSGGALTGLLLGVGVIVLLIVLAGSAAFSFT